MFFAQKELFSLCFNEAPFESTQYAHIIWQGMVHLVMKPVERKATKQKGCLMPAYLIISSL